MQQDKATFEKLIQEDRATRDVQSWRGTFLDYLERIKENPDLAKLAHARLARGHSAGRRARHRRL